MNWEKIQNVLVWFIWVFIRKRAVIFKQYLYFLLTKGAINEIAESHFLTPPCCLSNPLSSKK